MSTIYCDMRGILAYLSRYRCYYYALVYGLIELDAIRSGRRIVPISSAIVYSRVSVEAIMVYLCRSGRSPFSARGIVRGSIIYAT